MFGTPQTRCRCRRRPRSLTLEVCAEDDDNDSDVVVEKVLAVEGSSSDIGSKGQSSYGTTLRRECVKEASTCGGFTGTEGENGRTGAREEGGWCFRGHMNDHGTESRTSSKKSVTRLFLFLFGM